MSDSDNIPLDSIGFGGNYEVMSITDVPDEFSGKVLNFRVERKDGNITKIKLYVEYNGKLVVISYPQIYLSFLAEQLKKMGFTELSEIKGKAFKFKRMNTTAKLKRKVNYNPRHVPISLSQSKEEEEEEEEEKEEEEEEEEEETDNASKIKSKFKSK